MWAKPLLATRLSVDCFTLAFNKLQDLVRARPLLATDLLRVEILSLLVVGLTSAGSSPFLQQDLQHRVQLPVPRVMGIHSGLAPRSNELCCVCRHHTGFTMLDRSAERAGYLMRTLDSTTGD